MLFGTYLVDLGRQSSTIKSYFSAIKHVLKVDGYDWDDSKVMLSVVTKSCKLINDKVRIRLHIREHLFETLMFELERMYDTQWYLQYTYKAIFCLGYYGLMRIGEMVWSDHTLKACDVLVAKNRDKILLKLRTSKTHGQESKPQEIIIEGVNYTKKFFCLFEILRTYTKVRSNFVNKKEPYIIFADRTPVTPIHVRTTLRTALKAINLDEMLYNTHSLRAGRTVDLIRKYNFYN